MATVVNVLVVAVDRTAARAHAAYVNRIRGFRTIATVGSAAACVRRLAEGDVDLVLLDLSSPTVTVSSSRHGCANRDSPCDDRDVWPVPDEAPRCMHGARSRTSRSRLSRFADFRDTLISWAAARPRSRDRRA